MPRGLACAATDCLVALNALCHSRSGLSSVTVSKPNRLSPGSIRRFVECVDSGTFFSVYNIL